MNEEKPEGYDHYKLTVDLMQEKKELQMLLQKANGDIIRADRENERLKENCEVASQMINNLANELTRLENQNAGLKLENERLKEALKELIKIAERWQGGYQDPRSIAALWQERDKPLIENAKKLTGQ